MKMEINKGTLKEFRKDLSVALLSLERKYELKIELPNISYSEKEFHGTLKCFKLGDSGEKLADIQSKEEFDIYTYYGKLAGSFGFEFSGNNGELLRVIGYNPRRRANPIELLGVNTGKKYKASESFVLYHYHGGNK